MMENMKGSWFNKGGYWYAHLEWNDHFFGEQWVDLPFRECYEVLEGFCRRFKLPELAQELAAWAYVD